MLLTFAVAVGVLKYRQAPEAWLSAPHAGAAAWFALAMLGEVRQFWRRYRGLNDPSPEERGGWRFAMLWRLLLATVVIAALFHAFNRPAVSDSWLGTPFRGGENQLYLQKADPMLVIDICFVLALMSGQAPAAATRKLARFVWKPLGMAVGLFLCLLVWANVCLISFLVHLSVVGIERSAPKGFGFPGISWNVSAREDYFSQMAIVAGAVVLGNAFLTWLLAKHWRSVVWRCVTSGLLVAGLTAAVGYIAWLIAYGMYQLSPPMEVGMRTTTPLQVLLAAMIVAPAATVAAWRLVSGDGGGNPVDKRPNLPPAFSQPGWALMLAVMVFEAMRLPLEIWEILGSFEPIYFVAEPETYLTAAILVLGLRHAARRWFWSEESWAVAPRPLAWGRFCGVWLAALATLATAAPILAAVSFSMLLRYYNVPDWLVDATIDLHEAIGW